jgi:predicted RNase H-like nuclease (RuvC/YqgF family)
LITKQFLEAAANNQTNVKAENTSLKKELSRSQKQILDFEAQFDELKKNQSEVFLNIFPVIETRETKILSPFNF